ncbi:fimbrial biogenesis chaperone, partial [Raoultella ornithinolytica]
VWRRLLENSLSAKVSCWLIRLLILGSGYNTMISHLGLIRTFPYFVSFFSLSVGGKEIDEPGMIGPLTRKEWPVNGAGTIRWRAINDFGGITDSAQR